MASQSGTVVATLGTMWRGYLRLLEKYPWRTQAVNTCVLMGTGDFIAQAVIERRKAVTYEGKRTARFLGVGLCVFGPTMHFWYSNLDRFVKGTKHSVVLRKVFMDQCIFLPAYLGVFIALMGALRRESPREIQHKVHRDYVPLLMASYKLWPAVQIINFYLIPNRHRVLVINFVGLLWNTYVAWRSEQKD
jgi:protein Mpv17